MTRMGFVRYAWPCNSRASLSTPAVVTSGGERMRHIVITENATRADLEAAMVALTAKAKRACIPSTLHEIREDQDECVELWLEAEA